MTRICGAALATAISLAASTSFADDKEVCSAAYDQTQALRRGGKLQEAREQAAVCLRDACAEFIRTDCAKWIGELDASLPTIVFDVKDVRGNETSAVRVSLDGKPWLQALDGTAKPIDPGPHTLRYEIDGAPAVELKIQVREGEKNRLINASFEAKTAPAGDAGKGAPPAEEKRSILPWVIGGVGVAGLAVGGITGAIVLSKKSDFTAHCHGTAPLQCDPEGASAASTGRALGPVSTIGLVVGGVGVGVATVMLVTRKPSQKAAPTVGLASSVTPNGAGWHLEGTW